MGEGTAEADATGGGCGGKPMKVLCKNCGNVIGEYAINNGQVWIIVGSTLLLRSAHGVCSCGKEWHWCASNRSLNLLAKRLNPNVIDTIPIVVYNISVDG